jgi:hypothetical protein
MGPGAYPDSYTMSTRPFSGGKRPGRCVDHPPYLMPMGLRGVFKGELYLLHFNKVCGINIFMFSCTCFIYKLIYLPMYIHSFHIFVYVHIHSHTHTHTPTITHTYIHTLTHTHTHTHTHSHTHTNTYTHTHTQIRIYLDLRSSQV